MVTLAFNGLNSYVMSASVSNPLSANPTVFILLMNISGLTPNYFIQNGFTLF